MHGGGGRCSGSGVRCSETVYDANKRRTVQRSGGRCMVSVGQYTEMVYDARRADDAWSGVRCMERRTMQRSGERCMVSVRQYTEMVYDARSGVRCTERQAMH